MVELGIQLPVPLPVVGSYRPTKRHGATIYLALLGKEGFRKAATLSTAKAHYAAEVLGKIPGVTPRFGAPFFKEFALRLPKSPDRLLRALRKKRILGGVVSVLSSAI